MKKLFRSLFLFTILCSMMSPSVLASAEDPLIKIGLAYSTNALPGAKLMNVSGMEDGYCFGYFDSSREFHEISCTDERYLVVLKDKTVYMSTTEAFTDTKPSNCKKTINPYHLQTDDSFADYNAALDCAVDIKDYGYEAFPAYYMGKYVVRIGEYGSSSEAKLNESVVSDKVGYDLTATGGSTTCYTVALAESGEIVFEFDLGGQAFGVMPYSKNTWFSGYSYCGGFEYNRINGNDITVINVVGLHDYIKGVISNEMNPSWNIEALKAQALCAKSYCLTNLNKHSSLGFDLCNTTDCQVYFGTRQQTANSNKAVDDTFGLYVKYNGKIVSTVYHSSSGGYTEDAVNVWGKDVGYLKGVEDKYLKQTLPYNFSITNSQIKTVLKDKGYSVGDITDYYISSFTPFGNVRAVTFKQSNGKELTFTGEKARTIINSTSLGFQTKSQRYTITPSVGGLYINGNAFSGSLSNLFAIGSSGTKILNISSFSDVKVMTADGIGPLQAEKTSYYVSGCGSGHNVGMSQWGAKAMADLGYSYDEILRFYFTGIEIGPRN
ncbi:MAG: SpoIID/LytB domain-containing protein [Clostridiaceae bacterium]|nr:SpoIID/LytB domain-containing protein [Clostridiaceae bacterium]